MKVKQTERFLNRRIASVMTAKSKINGGAKILNWFWMTLAVAVASTAAIMYFSQAGSIRAQSGDSSEFHEGQVFPTMVFPSLGGSRAGSVADFRGKKLILH